MPNIVVMVKEKNLFRLQWTRDALLAFYKDRVRKLEDSLEAFYESSGGRLLLRYYTLRDRLLPQGSMRRQILASKLLSSLRRKH